VKKIIFVLLVSVVVFISCLVSYPADTVITNHSVDKTVTVKITSSEEIILAPGQSISIETKGTTEENMIEYYSPNKRVRYIRGSLKYDFYDRESYEVKILNLTGKTGSLTADGWLDTIYFSSSNNEQINNWLLYTNYPRFTARTDDGYPLQVLFIKEDNTFKLTIND